MSIRDDYFRILHRIHRDIGGDVVPFCIEEVHQLFDLLHNLDAEVILQTNRCHFIMSSLSEMYGCEVAHIVRNFADVWASMITAPLRKRSWLRPAYRMLREGPFGEWVLTRIFPKVGSVGKLFFIEEDFQRLSRRYELPACRDYLDKMLIVWAYFNYHAVEQVRSAGGTCISYESLVRDPDRTLKYLSDRTSVRFEKAIRITKREVHFKVSESYRSRIRKLGLSNMIERILLHCSILR